MKIAILIATLIIVVVQFCLADTATLHVVDPTSKPISGATVYLFDYATIKAPTQLTTDATGSFSAEVSDSQTDESLQLRCVVEAKGFAPTGALVVSGDHTIYLSLPVAVSGTVSSYNGAPIPDAKVIADYAQTTPNGPGAVDQFSMFGFKPIADSYSTTTDSNGNYKIAGCPGNSVIEVEASAPGFTSVRASTLSGGLSVPAIVLQRATSISGRVLLPDGKPANGMRVVAARQIANGRMFSLPVVTAADGTYKIDGLVPGTYFVRVSIPQRSMPPGAIGLVSPKIVQVAATLGTHCTAPEIMLVEGALASGVIVDAQTQQPIPGVFVDIRPSNSTPQMPQDVNAITDTHGSYAITVLPGKDQLYIYKAPPDYIFENDEFPYNFTAVTGQNLTLNPIALTRAAVVTGRVVDESGKPLPNLALKPQLGPNEMEMLGPPSETTDSNGAFTLHGLKPATYFLDFGQDWTVVSPMTFIVPSTSTLVVQLKRVPSAPLTGTVVDTTGTPVADVAISAQILYQVADTNEVAIGSATSDANGKFTIPDAPLAADRIEHPTAAKEGYVFQSGGDITTSNGQLTMSPIVLARFGGAINGIVRNGLGAPVPGAWVASTDTGGTTMPVQTDSTGHFSLSSLIVGPVNLIAAKGDYFGEQSAVARLPATEAIVDLGSVPTAPSPTGLKSGTQLLEQDLAAYLSTQNVGGDNGWIRDDFAAQIATISPDAALAFIGEYVEPSGTDLNGIIRAQDVVNPSGLTKWALPLLQRLPYDGDRGKNAVELGLDVAPFNLPAASTCYQIAMKAIRLDSLNDSNIDDAERLCALAYAVGSPNADDIYQKVSAGVNSLAKSRQSNQGADWHVADFGQQLAFGNVDLAIKILAAASRQARYFSTIEVVKDLVHSRPQSALAIFHALDSETDKTNFSWPYDSCLWQVLPTIFAADPKDALDLARAVGDLHDRAEALVTIADLLPLAQAEPIYREAESDSEDQTGQGTTPASIAAHAYLRDTALGIELYKEAFDKVIMSGTSNPGGQGPMYSEFAFYYSRIDPAFSRLLLENLFKTDMKQKNLNEVPGDSAVSDVSAMAAIDTNRATQLANSIQNPWVRFFASLRVAQYVLAPQHVRDTLSFSDWMSKDPDEVIGEGGPW